MSEELKASEAREASEERRRLTDERRRLSEERGSSDKTKKAPTRWTIKLNYSQSGHKFETITTEKENQSIIKNLEKIFDVPKKYRIFTKKSLPLEVHHLEHHSGHHHSHKTLSSTMSKVEENDYEECTTLLTFGKHCLSFETEQVQRVFLKRLRLTSQPQVVVDNLRLPNQYEKNCWFNCWLVCCFVSDLGRQHFKELRELMIKGEKRLRDGNTLSLILPQSLTRRDTQSLWKAFFKINYCIEKMFDGDNSSINTDNLFRINTQLELFAGNRKNEVKELIKEEKVEKQIRLLRIEEADLNKQINYLKNDGKKEYRSVLDFFEAITDIFDYQNKIIKKKSFFSNDTINFVKNDISRNPTDNTDYSKTIIPYAPIAYITKETIVHFEVYKFNEPPTLITLEYDFFEFNKYPTLLLENKYEYRLDSICMLDITAKHYACLFTLNGVECMFDSDTKETTNVKKYKEKEWKKYLNKDTSQDDFNLYKDDSEFNLFKAYGLYFYYLVT